MKKSRNVEGAGKSRIARKQEVKGEGSRVKQSRKVRRNAGVSKEAEKGSKEEESKQQKTGKNVSSNSGISSGAKYDSRVQSRNTCYNRCRCRYL